MKGARQIQTVFRLGAVANQDHIESIGLGTARRKRIARVFEANGLVSECRQFFFVRQQVFSFAFDDQHGLAVPKGEQLRLIRYTATPCRRGQPYVKAASLPRSALRANGSIMVSNDFANRCQTEAGPGQASGKKGLKHSSRNAFIKATPIIADRKTDVSAWRQFAIAHLKEINHLLHLRGHAESDRCPPSLARHWCTD